MRLPTWLWARITATIDAVVSYFAPLGAVVLVTLALSEPALSLLSVAAGSAILAGAVLALEATRRRRLLSRESGGRRSRSPAPPGYLFPSEAVVVWSLWRAAAALKQQP